MIVCIAVDDNYGMMFNKRRQSKDKFLREDLIKFCNGSVLWMNEYSSRQFEIPLPFNVSVDEDFLNKAGENEYCFVENLPLISYQEKIEQIILYKWNRVYPADTHLDISLPENGWVLGETTEFQGNSHEKITKEVWVYEK